MNISLYFNRQRMKKDGSIPISLCVKRRESRFYISSGLSSTAVFDGDIFPRTEKNARAKTIRLGQMMDAVEEVLLTNATMSDENIKELIKERVFGIKPNVKTLADYVHDFCLTKTEPSTIEKYAGTEKKIRAFDDTITLDSLNYGWLERFEAHLRKTTAVNTTAINLRNIRAVVNWAINNEWTDNYPFRRFKIKHEATRKKNIDADTLRMLRDATLPPRLEKYRDMFMLMFYMIGINGKDLLLARKEQIVNGRFEFARAKTHRLYSIRLEDEALAIIDKYKGKELMLSFCEDNPNYRKVMMLADRHLKSIVPNLSTNYARHTWATLARRLHIPKDDISLAMGHSYGCNTTSIYIEENLDFIDQANRKVLDYVKGNAE